MTSGIYIESIGLVGPGLPDWPHAAGVLAGRTAYVPARTAPPPAAGLPPAERRRSSAAVKIALAAGLEAVAASGREVSTLATVFSASSGDGHNFHAICETLASDERQLSPTRFHNSVHNAPASYWSIATRSMTPSNVLCAYDGSFAAGLFESACQVVADRVPTLLIVYDTDYPEPLHAVRPIDDGFGLAMVLSPDAGLTAIARIDVRLTDAPPTLLASAKLDALRRGNPAARALPLLEALAVRRATNVVLDYLPDTRMQVGIAFSDNFSAKAGR